MIQSFIYVMFAVILASALVLQDECVGANAPVQYFVSPTGNDSHTGTKQKPFASIAKARDAVRDKTKGGQASDIVVYLQGGTHELAEPLVLQPHDSGTEQFSITYAAYPGEHPVISGGRRIAGWKRGPGKLWQVEVPQAKAQQWYFRQLFIDGKRATRARTPNVDDEQLYYSVKGGELKDDTWKVSLSAGEVKDWSNLTDVEIVALGQWDLIRKNLAMVDTDRSEVIMAPPHVRTHHHDPRAGSWCFFENAIEMLDQPGEWYLDRVTGVLSYWPLAGQDMSKVEVVAPVLSQLVKVAGTSKQVIQNVHFKGLTFKHARWPFPKWGFAGRQGGTMYGGSGFVGEAILWNFAKSCSMTDCEIAHVGGCGISLLEGCVDNHLAGNHIHDISSNGINIGEDLSTIYDTIKTSEYGTPRNNRVTNNYIHGCGADLYGGVGIYVAYTDGTIVAHNLLHDLPYTAINVGMMWGGTETICRNNLVEYNHIYDIMKKMGDGAGVYTLGYQPGTVVRKNLIHDVRRNRFARGGPYAGLYFDNTSSGILIEDNIVYGIAEPKWPCAHVLIGYYSKDLIFRRNVFVTSQADVKVFHYYVAKEEESTFEDNTTVLQADWQRPADLDNRMGLEPRYRKALLGR
mgnify:CR=1 FL=1